MRRLTEERDGVAGTGGDEHDGLRRRVGGGHDRVVHLLPRDWAAAHEHDSHQTTSTRLAANRARRRAREGSDGESRRPRWGARPGRAGILSGAWVGGRRKTERAGARRARWDGRPAVLMASVQAPTTTRPHPCDAATLMPPAARAATATATASFACSAGGGVKLR